MAENGSKGKKWYHLGAETKRFFPDEKPQGWEVGMSEERKKEMQKKCIETKIKNYGSLETANKIAREKAEKTCLKKYGVTSNFKDPKSMKRREETWLKKYGVKNPNQNKEVREKTKQTCIEKYGAACALNILDKDEVNKKRIEKFGSIEAYWDDQKEKHKNTNLEKYKVESYFQSEDFQNKRAEAILNKYGSFQAFYDSQQEKLKKTCSEKFGSTNVFSSDYFKQLMTDQKKKDRVEKANATKIKNKSFNTSKDEEKLYNILCNKYGAENVITPYTSARYADKNGYQFKCDFYVTSQDLFIELNDHWTHGGHPFDNTNAEDLLLLKKWQERAEESKFFKNAIYVWTDLDVKKQKCAKENNLNYIVIYRKEDINESNI